MAHAQNADARHDLHIKLKDSREDVELRVVSRKGLVFRLGGWTSVWQSPQEKKNRVQ